MFSIVRATVRNGKIEPVESVVLDEGSTVLVILPSGEEDWFWPQASLRSLEAIWDNPDDDVYAQLLEE